MQWRTMNKLLLLALAFVFSQPLFSQRITLQPMQGHMVCTAQVPQLGRQTFALGLPETIGSSEGMILNFPGVDIQWEGPDQNGVLRHSWHSSGAVEYSLVVTPYDDYVDAQMSIRNISRGNWTNVFSFNCLNPVNAPSFLDWTLERTYMSKNGRPFRLDATTRVNNGPMKTVQFYVNEAVYPVSPFVNGFQATSPDRTDDSYIVTLSDDGNSYMAATSPTSCFLFNNLDRCCIHSATNFGDIPSGGEASVTSRFYLAKGTLEDFIERFETEIKNTEKSEERVLMCWGNPWSLADTTQWPNVYRNLDIQKIYIGDISERDKEQMRLFVRALLSRDIKIAIELGGLLDWHASKGDQAAAASFQQDYNNVKPLIDMIKEIDASRGIDMLDMDGPIRRMLFPNNVKSNYHTIASAVEELFKVVQWWRDSIPGIELNLLTNFPNWAWGDTPSYFRISGERDGYGQYMDVLDAVEAKSIETGLHFDALTIDNPYDYAIGRAQSNHPDVIAGVDWMQRIVELDARAREMGLKVNMIFNTNSGRNAQLYSEQTLDFIDYYHQRVRRPDGYWIQSWYQLPDTWLPETAAYSMTNLTLEAMKKLGRLPEVDPTPALLEPEHGRVYHGVQTMTFEAAPDPLAGYLGALNDESIQPAVRGLFFSIPGSRGPDMSLKRLGEFFNEADSIGFIPELSLFLVSDVATDTIIATSDVYDAVIDSIITLSMQYGKPMFLRIGGEFNGQGPNWNGGGYTPHHYVAMFRKITDMYSARGFRDSIATIWCYYPAADNDFDSVDARGALWYPGDEYVDWFGLDLFDPEDFDLALPDYHRGVITRKGKSERFLAMARSKGKPVYLSETSAKGMNLTADPGDSQSDWESWFAKFWAFISAHPEIKGFSYINANWPDHAYPGWGDARIQNSPLISSMYRKELKTQKYIHLPYTLSTGDHAAALADHVLLHPNYPNPAHDNTTIIVQLAAMSTLRIDIHDALGRRIRTLTDGVYSAGVHRLLWDGRNDEGALLGAGMYIYRVQSPATTSSGKLLLIR